MLVKAKKQLRSWMFIYVGLAAAILLSGTPANENAESRLEATQLPVIADAPLLRRDI